MIKKVLYGISSAVLFPFVLLSCSRNENGRDDNEGFSASYFDISPRVSIVNDKNVDLLNPNNKEAYDITKDIYLQTGDLVKRALMHKPNPIFLDDTEDNRRGYKIINYQTDGLYKILINSFKFKRKDPFYTETISIKSKSGKVYEHTIKAESIYYSGKPNMVGGSSLYLKKLWLDDKLVWERGDLSSEEYNPLVTIIVPDNN